MHADTSGHEEADALIARHGPAAIGALIGEIRDAVRLSDEQAVGRLDRILQLVEARLEGPWRSGDRRFG